MQPNQTEQNDISISNTPAPTLSLLSHQHHIPWTVTQHTAQWQAHVACQQPSRERASNPSQPSVTKRIGWRWTGHSDMPIWSEPPHIPVRPEISPALPSLSTQQANTVPVQSTQPITPFLYGQLAEPTNAHVTTAPSHSNPFLTAKGIRTEQQDAFKSPEHSAANAREQQYELKELWHIAA